MRWFLAFALCCSGCVFKLRSVDAGAGGDDFGGVADLGVGGDDLGDGDMAVAEPGDLAEGPDLATPLLTLSHVPQHYLTDGTCDLVVTTSIDTASRKVDGSDVPAGCIFADETETGGLLVAVLAAHSVVFNGNVVVTGSAPLVVVSGTTISVNGAVDASAKGATAGPGGSGTLTATGKGPDGAHDGASGNCQNNNSCADSGGSGGSSAPSAASAASARSAATTRRHKPRARPTATTS